MKHNKRIIIYKVLVLVFVIAAFVWPKLINQDAEINNRATAIAIGIDVNNDDDRGPVLASAQILVPMPQGQQAGKQEIFFGTGRTLAEALDYINVKLGRILDFGQVGVIVFGEEKAKEGIVSDLKYLINNKVRAESTIFVACNSEARELLKKANKLTEEATSSLNNFLKFNAQSTYMPNINMLEFLSDYGGADKSSFVPMLNIQSQDTITLSDGSIDKKLNVEGNKEGGQEKGQKGDSTGGQGESGSGQALNEIKDVDRVYLFKDGKIAGELDKNQTKGLVWHNKDTYFGLFTVENVEIDGHTIKYLPCDLRAKHVSYKVKFENGVPVITYKFNLHFNSEDLHEINENNDVRKAFSGKDINNSVKKAVEQKVKNDIEVCLSKLQEVDIDALRIKQQFYKFRHREYKKYISQNPDFLQNIEIRYKFNIKLY